MNIKLAGVISTGLVITLSVLFVIPPYLSYATTQPILLVFTITEKEDSSKWCLELSDMLDNYNVKAAVFISGSIAEKFPDCVTSFSDDVDIGSQGYHYLSIPKIPDYSQQIEEITHGKQAIDKIGNFNSKLFSSPYGDTDQNIYSILNKSGIQADFSYKNQYNIFLNGQFIWFNVTSYDVSEFNIDLIPTKRSDNPSPIIIHIENNYPVNKITEIIFDLKEQKTIFVNASDLAGFDLTERSKK